MKETEIPKKSGGITSKIFGLLMLYAIVIGCYYGYKKYKESQLCKPDTVGLFIAAAFVDESFIAWASDAIDNRNYTLEEALVEYAMANEKIFKKGEPFDLSTVFDDTPTCAENDQICKDEITESRLIKGCKENVGGFRLSTLYFGDGFYNYSPP